MQVVHTWILLLIEGTTCQFSTPIMGSVPGEDEIGLWMHKLNRAGYSFSILDDNLRGSSSQTCEKSRSKEPSSRIQPSMFINRTRNCCS
jgi:hypothetical protein